MDKIVVFPIIITPVPYERKYPYLVEIPALDGMTEGATLLMPSKWHAITLELIHFPLSCHLLKRPYLQLKLIH